MVPGARLCSERLAPRCHAKYFRAITELTKASRGAISELYGARVHYRQELNKRKNDEERDAKRRRTMHGVAAEAATTTRALVQEVADGSVFDFREAGCGMMMCTSIGFKERPLDAQTQLVIITGMNMMQAHCKNDEALANDISDNLGQFRVDSNRQMGTKAEFRDDSVRAAVRRLIVAALPAFEVESLASLPAHHHVNFDSGCTMMFRRSPNIQTYLF